MDSTARVWLKPLLTLAAVSTFAWFSPAHPIDPWGLVSPQKITTLIFALTFIQIAGVVLARLLGARSGAILSGFLGGLISSTTVTAALARHSKLSASSDAAEETLTFLAATGAMLFEGMALLLAGTTQLHSSLLLIFLGPLSVTALLISVHAKQMHNRFETPETKPFQIVPLLKLAAFIAAILLLSKILQRVFGQAGLLVLTFLVSLFEIHGSVIANLQLHESGSVGVFLLGGLLSISVFASYLSKLFLIYSLGSAKLKIKATQITVLLLVSLAASYLLFTAWGAANAA